jgi:uncharacterized membrane protein HdeD (DUF308 family)
MPLSRVTRTLIALYAAAVVAAGLLVLVVSVLQDGDGLVAIWLITLTLPLSVLALVTPAEGGVMLGLLVGAGLLQAWGLWLLAARRARRRATEPQRSRL